jgi:hypothetical protein
MREGERTLPSPKSVEIQRIVEFWGTNSGTRVQWVVATVLAFDPFRSTLAGVVLRGGAGQAAAWPVVPAAEGPQRSPGSGPAPAGAVAERRVSGLEAGGAAPDAARHPCGDERRRQPPP